MRVRARKWERLYRMRAQSGVYRFDICVSRSRIIFFFFFSFSNCYHLRNRNLIYRWLMAGVRFVRAKKEVAHLVRFLRIGRKDRRLMKGNEHGIFKEVRDMNRISRFEREFEAPFLKEKLLFWWRHVFYLNLTLRY